MARKNAKPNFIRRKGKKLFGAAKEKVLEAEKNRAKKRNRSRRKKNISLTAAGQVLDALRSKNRKRNAGRYQPGKAIFDRAREKAKSSGHSQFVYMTSSGLVVSGEKPHGKQSLEIKPSGQETRHANRKRNLDHRDAAHPIEVRRYWQGRKGYETPWQRAHKAGQKQLFAMNPPGGDLYIVIYKTKDGKEHQRRFYTYAEAKLYADIKRSQGLSVRMMRKNPAMLTLVNGRRRGAARRGRGRRRKNSDDLYQDFHGHPSTEDVQVYGPDGMPDDLIMLGKLDEVFYSADGDSTANGLTNDYLNFDGSCCLASNKAGTKYYIVSTRESSLPRYEPSGEFGFATRVTYRARKDHLEGDSRERGYWHKLGEENGVLPRLCTDDEGFLIFRGGDYHTEPDGIIN